MSYMATWLKTIVNRKHLKPLRLSASGFAVGKWSKSLIELLDY